MLLPPRWLPQLQPICSLIPHVCALLSVIALTACSTSDFELGHGALRDSLPLGRGDLVEAHETTVVAPGVTLQTIRRSSKSKPVSSWTLRSPPLLSETDFSELKNCLTTRTSALVTFDRYAYPGQPDLTYRIINGSIFPSLEAAVSDVSYPAFKACGFKPQDIGLTPRSDNGPWQINVLEIDPSLFAGRIAVKLANDVLAGLEPVQAIAERTRAIAAVNASFFVMHEADGIVGDVAGLTVVGGRIISEPLNGRAILVLANKPKVSGRIADMNAEVRLLLPDGTKLVVDGINRMPGLTRNCGNAGDVPTSMAVHDATCSDSGEIIILESMAGFALDSNLPFRVFVNYLGLVSAAIPEDWAAQGGFVIAATGDRASELAHVLTPGTSTRILNEFGDGGTDVFAVNGAPLLLRGSENIDRAHIEGWPLDLGTSSARADEIHRWINLRAPRTAVGIRGDGRLLLVTIDGRQKKVSVGATISELRSVMRALGAEDALNLDGGGSSTMIVNGRIVNSPSDPSGPRPVADAIILYDDAN